MNRARFINIYDDDFLRFYLQAISSNLDEIVMNNYTHGDFEALMHEKLVISLIIYN